MTCRDTRNVGEGAGGAKEGRGGRSEVGGRMGDGERAELRAEEVRAEEVRAEVAAEGRRCAPTDVGAFDPLNL